MSFFHSNLPIQHIISFLPSSLSSPCPSANYSKLKSIYVYLCSLMKPDINSKLVFSVAKNYPAHNKSTLGSLIMISTCEETQYFLSIGNNYQDKLIFLNLFGLLERGYEITIAWLLLASQWSGLNFRPVTLLVNSVVRDSRVGGLNLFGFSLSLNKASTSPHLILSRPDTGKHAGGQKISAKNIMTHWRQTQVWAFIIDVSRRLSVKVIKK